MKKHSEEEFEKELQKFQEESNDLRLAISKIFNPPADMISGEDYDVLNLLLNVFYLRRLEVCFIKKLYHPELSKHNIDILSQMLADSQLCFLQDNKNFLETTTELAKYELNEFKHAKLKDITTYVEEVFSIQEEILTNPYYIKLMTKENSNE